MIDCTRGSRRDGRSAAELQKRYNKSRRYKEMKGKEYEKVEIIKWEG